eukprot:scaffold154277_cov50-Prasinocladus_malaysianus.AAC.1
MRIGIIGRWGGVSSRNLVPPSYKHLHEYYSYQFSDRHNSTLRLLLDKLNEETGGRWPTIAADCGTHPTWEFPVTSHDTPDSLLDMSIEWADTPGRRAAAHSEGQADSLTHTPVTLPQCFLPQKDRPTYFKPDAIRLVGVDWNPRTQKWRNHSDNGGPKLLQILEFKYYTDTNGHEVAAHIHDKYRDLASAI